ncbi:MAG: lytic murein transglycosylase [Jatrophihabitantaceae bacterium]
MSQPRYAPRRARLKLSLTRTVTSAAALAALALVCGPALDPSTDNAAAATAIGAAAIDTPGPAGTTSTATSVAPAPRSGPLPVRPSRIATPRPASADVGLLSVEPVALGPAGEVGALGIPLMVLRAYHLAADQLGVEQPSCKLPWWLLAGIGHTESGHAESGRLIADGTTRGRILGPRLNGGIVGDAIITDTDHGSYDGDTVYDRAVGPMQFIPSTWVRWGADGNSDGKVDPSNIFDATLSAGRYLCANGRDLATGAGLQAAVLSYNHSAPYLATVLAWGAAYRDGASALPDSLLPVVSDVTKVRPPRSSRPPKPATNPGKLPSAGPTAATSSSQPGPSASASSSAAETSSATATASPTASCPSTSPPPTDSKSSQSSSPVNPATAQSLPSRAATSTSTASGSATASGSGSSTATTSGSGSATSSGSGPTTGTATASGSRVQSATAQSLTSGSASSTSASSTASPSLSSCAP